MLTPKEILKPNECHLELNTLLPRKAAKEGVIRQFERAMQPESVNVNSGVSLAAPQENQAEPQVIRPSRQVKQDSTLEQDSQLDSTPPKQSTNKPNEAVLKHDTGLEPEIKTQATR